MTSPRIEALTAKLEKGGRKTLDALRELSPAQWDAILYPDPEWRVTNLLAHLLSAEEQLLALAQNVAADGGGAPDAFPIDRFNAEAQRQLAGKTRAAMLAELEYARARTLEWLKTIEDSQLDRRGRHPALGDMDLGGMLQAIHAHHLMHLRDLARSLKDPSPPSS